MFDILPGEVLHAIFSDVDAQTVLNMTCVSHHVGEWARFTLAANRVYHMARALKFYKTLAVHMIDPTDDSKQFQLLGGLTCREIGKRTTTLWRRSPWWDQREDLEFALSENPLEHNEADLLSSAPWYCNDRQMKRCFESRTESGRVILVNAGLTNRFEITHPANFMRGVLAQQSRRNGKPYAGIFAIVERNSDKPPHTSKEVTQNVHGQGVVVVTPKQRTNAFELEDIVPLGCVHKVRSDGCPTYANLEREMDFYSIFDELFKSYGSPKSSLANAKVALLCTMDNAGSVFYGSKANRALGRLKTAGVDVYILAVEKHRMPSQTACALVDTVVVPASGVVPQNDHRLNKTLSDILGPPVEPFVDDAELPPLHFEDETYEREPELMDISRTLEARKALSSFNPDNLPSPNRFVTFERACEEVGAHDIPDSLTDRGPLDYTELSHFLSTDYLSIAELHADNYISSFQ